MHDMTFMNRDMPSLHSFSSQPRSSDAGSEITRNTSINSEYDSSDKPNFGGAREIEQQAQSTNQQE